MGHFSIYSLLDRLCERTNIRGNTCLWRVGCFLRRAKLNIGVTILSDTHSRSSILSQKQHVLYGKGEGDHRCYGISKRWWKLGRLRHQGSSQYLTEVEHGKRDTLKR